MSFVFEAMDAIDSEKLIEDVGNKLITTRAASPPILILEGIFIFKFRVGFIIHKIPFIFI